MIFLIIRLEEIKEGGVLMLNYHSVGIQFNDKMIVNDFNLHLESGDKVLLKAPSGSGKSTLLKAALGFVQLAGGEISIDGVRNDARSICMNRGKISYVSQDVDLMPVKSREFINEVFTFKMNKHLTYKDDKLLEQMAYFELPEALLDKNVSDLSGGERQRLGLVIAFLLKRKILLLDEVTSALDKHLKEKVVAEIMASDATVLTVSHDDLWEASGVKVVNV